MLKKIHSINAELTGQAHKRDVKVQKLCVSGVSLFAGRILAGVNWPTTRVGSSRRAAGLQHSLKNVRQKIPPNGQTHLKSGYSCEISQHNHFRYFRHHCRSTFRRNPTQPMFSYFPTTPLMRWRFQYACRWIWRFRGCFPHSPKKKKPNNWL